MTPEREFVLTAFSQYLDHHPHEVRKQAMDMCVKYLEQHEKRNRLEEHAKLLEEKVDELKIDYQILRIELEIQQQKNLALNNNNIHRQLVELPNFLSSFPRRYLQS